VTGLDLLQTLCKKSLSTHNKEAHHTTKQFQSRGLPGVFSLSLNKEAAMLHLSKAGIKKLLLLGKKDA